MNQDLSPSPVPTPGLREEAAAWFAKMRGDGAAAHRAAFEEWLARGAVHRAAYNRIGEVFAAGKILKPPGLLDKPRKARRRFALIALSAVLFASAGAAWQHLANLRVSQDATVRLARAPGSSVRSIDLASNERVLLDVDGVVTRRVDGDTGVVRLEQGRARFAISNDPQVRHVFAGGCDFGSTGGTFDVWLRPDGMLDARVLAGSVELRPAIFVQSGQSVQPVTLVAGAAYRVDASGREVDRFGSTGTAWPEGVLEFRGPPLADVLAEANRYSALEIVHADPSLGALRVSGRFTIDGPRRLARRLAAALLLDLDTTRPGVLLLRSKKKSI